MQYIFSLLKYFSFLTRTQLDERVREQRKLTITSLLTLTFFIITYLPVVKNYEIPN